jgi:hypothetical protein
MSKKLFEVLQAMLDKDIEEGLEDGDKNRIVRSNTLVSAKLVKQGVQITMGLGGNAKTMLDLESQKKIPILFLVDYEEYKKFEK